MEIKTKYNVGDKVWIMRNNKPEKIQISNRKQRTYKIINQNHTINNPGPYIYICKTTDLTCKEISRCICKYRTDKASRHTASWTAWGAVAWHMPT